MAGLIVARSGMLAAAASKWILHLHESKSSLVPESAWIEGAQPWSAVEGLRNDAADINGRVLAAGDLTPQVSEIWSGSSVEDLHSEYWNIFPSGNRNAASHLWSRFVLERSLQMSSETLQSLFMGFCPVSGSPVQPSDAKAYQYSLEKVDGSGEAKGIIYHCCWPCFCDMKDFVKVDTKHVVTTDGERTYNVLVLGNPCAHPEQLDVEHEDVFNGGTYTLKQSAPDLKCSDGSLDGAVMSDNGYVIIGMIHDHPDAIENQELLDVCVERAQSGYRSGMGTIFRIAAAISPISIGTPVTDENGASENTSTNQCDDLGASGRCCTGVLSESAIATINKDVYSSKVVLYGWAGCECTTIARSRFQEKGLCFLENVWTESDSKTMDYLNCKYGDAHHSFIWVNGEFRGNGFQFAIDAMTDVQYTSMLQAAQAPVGMCQFHGDKNLIGEPLHSCTQDGDGGTTGWTRTGSCVWDPSDVGYHQVCVTMSSAFLASSAEHDANDLTSVVSAGGHWCICAWAWASAVSRDPDNMEGIKIDCERTNGRLRQVYELHINEGRSITSPSGAAYASQAALDALDMKCPRTNSTTNSITNSTTQLNASDASKAIRTLPVAVFVALVAAAALA